MSNSYPNEDLLEADLVFHEQADGRMVAKIAGGKAVLLESKEFGRVRDGEKWRVRLRHFDTYAFATLIKPCPDNPVLASTLGSVLKASAPGGLASLRKDSGKAGGPISMAGRAAPAIEIDRGRPPAEISKLPPVSNPALPDVFEASGQDLLRPPDPGQVVLPGDRVALFVDGANMDWSCRRAGYFVDYGKAREFFLAGGKFYAGYFYIADFTDRDSQQLRFLDFLARSGYIVRRRPVKVLYDDDTGERILKGNLDTEIVLDMLNTVDNYDVAFLFSGDSDFERAVDLLRSRGKRVYIVTAARQLSRELMYAADKPIFLLESCRESLIREERWTGAKESKGGE